MIPPIQGGVYRTAEEIAAATEDEGISMGSISSGSNSSDDETPIATRLRTTAKLRDPEKQSRKQIPIVCAPAARDLPKSEELLAEYEQQLLAEDLEKYPSLDYATQRLISEKYRQLEAKLFQEGYFQCTYWGYARECVRYFTFGGLAYLFLRLKWYLTSAFFLGFMWHQLVFTVHDAGHYAITHDFFIDNFIGAFIASYIGGLSVGWWKHNHNVHHFVTNDPIHDPDIQHLPFFAVSTKLFGDVFSTYYEKTLWFDAAAKFFVRFQNYTYYLILCFGRFNLYRLSWQYLLLGQGPMKGKAAWCRYFEIVGQFVFWYWYGYKLLYQTLPTAGVRIAYVFVSNMVTMPLHVQITLSHFAMSTTDLGASESFAQKMLRTTMDVDCPTWLDFFHGGLQFQAIHHLFPRMPRHNFRSAQSAVIEFCKDIDVQYCIYGFTEGNKEVIGRLGDIAKQASIMRDCSMHISQELAVTGKIEM